MNELALFSGAGGGILAGKLLGWRTVCGVENDTYAASVLAQRQNDGILEPFPVWDDIRTFDGKPWEGIVDVVSGGFPCQDISINTKGKGIEGERSSLWKEMARIIGETKPRYVFAENSPILSRRGLGIVAGDLAEMGYDAEWCVLGADQMGAPHERKRMWIVATDSHIKYDGQNEKGKTLSYQEGWMENSTRGRKSGVNESWTNTWWETEPSICRVDDGMAYRMDRLRTTGNGQVPIVAATAFELLRGFLEDES